MVPSHDLNQRPVNCKSVSLPTAQLLHPQLHYKLIYFLVELCSNSDHKQKTSSKDDERCRNVICMWCITPAFTVHSSVHDCSFMTTWMTFDCEAWQGSIIPYWITNAVATADPRWDSWLAGDSASKQNMVVTITRQMLDMSYGEVLAVLYCNYAVC